MLLGVLHQCAEVTSADMYWYTDPYETGPPQSGTSSGYGWSMRRMRMLDAKDGQRTPQWGFVEVTDAMNGGSPITPAEIRGAVWHTLIAGARGIIYFQHDFAGACMTHHALRETRKLLLRGSDRHGYVDQPPDQEPRARPERAVGGISGHSASDRMAGKVRYMVKWAKGKFWVFAGADRGGGNATFRIRCVGNATAKVLLGDPVHPRPTGLVHGLLRGQEHRPRLPHRRRLALWPRVADAPQALGACR